MTDLIGENETWGDIRAKLNGLVPVVKTTTYTAAAGDAIIADTSAGSFTLTLPSGPSAGASVRIIGNGWATNNLTIARNGQTIDGLSENMVCDYDTDLLLLFIGGTWTY